MTFGLVSFGTALGEPAAVADVLAQYSEDDERILGYGYRTVLRCPAHVGLTDLAVDAATSALAAADIAPGSVDLLVLACTDIAEYLYWDAASSVAHRVGARRAEAVLLDQACTGGVLSFDTVAGKLATHPAYQTALIIAANRTCEAYWNRLDTQPMVFSDGAAAAVAIREHSRLRWLATEVITDGSFADFYRLDAGGAARPFGPGTAAEDLRATDAWSVLEFFDYDSARFEQFATLIDERTRDVIDAACARTGSRVDKLARLALLSNNAQAMAAIAERLGVPLSRTNYDLALEFGHLGAADQLFCLSRYADGADLTPGDRIALASRGRGMHWACTMLEV